MHDTILFDTNFDNRLYHVYKHLTKCQTGLTTVFGRPFVKRFALCHRSVVLSCPVLSVCRSVTFVHCSQTVGRIKMKRGTQVGLGPGHIVLGGDPALLPLKGHSPPPNFRPISCGQMAAWITMSLGMVLGLGPGDFAPPQKGGGPPNFCLCLL